MIRLSKTDSANDTQTLSLNIRMGGTDEVDSIWTIDASSLPFWLSPSSVSGVIGATNQTGTLTLTANTAGVPERVDPYTAALNVSVTSQRDKSFLVLVELYVSASTLASTSIWGQVSGPAIGITSGERECRAGAAATEDDPIKVVLGKTIPIPFTACDSEGLAVDHEDGGSFSAELIDQSSGSGISLSPPLNIAYTLQGTHDVLVRSDLVAGRRLGEFGLRLSFTANGGTPEQVGVERAVRAVCPGGLIELSDGDSCGCEAGRYLNEISPNVLVCELCEVGRYCSEGAAIGGSPCPTGFTTNGLGAKSSDECGCRKGTYESTATGADITCELCNEDMNCTRTGLALATVQLLPSRWRLSNSTSATYECDSSACLGGNWKGASDGYCAQGHEGPRCEWCSDPNRYYDDVTATCKDCGDMAGYALRQMAILLAIAVALGLLRAAVLRAPRLLARTSRRLAQVATSMQQFGLQAKFKCCLTFYQVYAVRKSVYGFELPGSLGGVMAFFDALSFDVGSFIFPSWTCLGGLTARLVFSGLWPLALMAVLAFCLFGLEAARKAPIQRALVRSLEAFVFISFCVLPSVTRSLFVAFQCESFGSDDSARPPESRTYLSASLNIECHTSAEHELIYITACIFIVLWPVVMPLLYATLLFRCRHAILKHQPSTLSRAIRFLWFDYDDRCFWFEMVELGQKLVLTNFLLLVNLGEDGGNKLLRLFIGLLIALFGLTLQLILQPFRKRTDDAIACGVRLMLVLFFIMGIMVKLCDTDGVNTVHSLLDAQVEASAFCFTLVGVHTAEAVAWLLFCAGLLVVLVPLGLLVQKLAFSQSIPILRDSQTMEPPVLLLGPGERYHLFLSHVWSTGQDQCAVIKRQLQLLLPGVVIFLDVDGTWPLPALSFPPACSDLCPHPLQLMSGRLAGHWQLGGLRASHGRDALLPVKALLHLAQLPSRGQSVNRLSTAAGAGARAAGGEGWRAARSSAGGVPRGDALVCL